MTAHEPESVHDAVGAYALGVLDDADASAFETHLAGCEVCAAHLDEFSGMEPLLALLAEAPTGQAAPVATDAPDGGLRAVGPPGLPGPRSAGRAEAPPPAPPGPRLLDGLLDEVAAKRAARRRRGRYLVAAAAALVIGASTIAFVTASDEKPTVAVSPAETAFFNDMEQKVAATDAATAATATVGTEKKGWGTHVVLRLENVKGPLKCSLIAVGKNGEEETVTSWAVPKWGYGIADSPRDTARKPLFVHGGAAMKRSDIDRFEVRTSDGKRLVEVDA
ncbi:zf-HC2 domain-containing protein [Streptomyces jumonjinensis]